MTGIHFALLHPRCDQNPRDFLPGPAGGLWKGEPSSAHRSAGGAAWASTGNAPSFPSGLWVTELLLSFTSDLQKMTPFLAGGPWRAAITETHLKFWGLPGELVFGSPRHTQHRFKTQKTSDSNGASFHSVQ